jgi:hypothetical protein
MKMKRAADYGVNDPVFDGMWLQRLAGTDYGTWIVRCECAKRKRLDQSEIRRSGSMPSGPVSWKRMPGTSAKVYSLGAARDWAHQHLSGPDHQ